MNVKLDTARKQPWQHLLGERCRARLSTRLIPNHRGPQRPCRNTLRKRLGLDLEQIDPEDRD